MLAIEPGEGSEEDTLAYLSLLFEILRRKLPKSAQQHHPGPLVQVGLYIYCVKEFVSRLPCSEKKSLLVDLRSHAIEVHLASSPLHRYWNQFGEKELVKIVRIWTTRRE